MKTKATHIFSTQCAGFKVILVECCWTVREGWLASTQQLLTQQVPPDFVTTFFKRVLISCLGDQRGCSCAGRGASSGVGFAIPIDSVKGLVDQILRYGRVVRPTMGITIAPPQVLRQIGEEGCPGAGRATRHPCCQSRHSGYLQVSSLRSNHQRLSTF